MKSMLNREVLNALKSCRQSTEVRPGKKHWKVYVGNKLAAVMSYGSRANDTPRALQNTLALIRRADASCP